MLREETMELLATRFVAILDFNEPDYPNIAKTLKISLAELASLKSKIAGVIVDDTVSLGWSGLRGNDLENFSHITKITGSLIVSNNCLTTLKGFSGHINEDLLAMNNKIDSLEDIPSHGGEASFSGNSGNLDYRRYKEDLLAARKKREDMLKNTSKASLIAEGFGW